MVGILDKDSPYCDKTDSSLSTAVGTARVHPNYKLTVMGIMGSSLRGLETDVAAAVQPNMWFITHEVSMLYSDDSL